MTKSFQEKAAAGCHRLTTSPGTFAGRRTRSQNGELCKRIDSVVIHDNINYRRSGSGANRKIGDEQKKF
jgi:hypothetical protein